MSCYYPIEALRPIGGGPLSFGSSRDPRNQNFNPVQIACGQCIGCRLKRSREWAIRCVHEASLNDVNCFLTLTYDEGNEPAGSSLHYPHFQSFMKRLRARFPCVRVKYFVCGEYGELFDRPHYHALLFGFDFLDKTYWSKSPSGSVNYRSPVLEDLWPHGFSTIGSVTFESAAYTARYIMKKVTGDLADAHYSVVDRETGEIVKRVPEFCHMSLKPLEPGLPGGIGANWLSRFRGDVYPSGRVTRPGGASFNAPRYYDKLFDRYEKEIGGVEGDLVEYGRYLEGLKHRGDQSPERLKVRETVARARVKQLKRSLT